jgi:DNA invertase Pin-like site-specific DNA recombinase
MRIGYARVSTSRQHTDGQEARLREAGCTEVYVDHGASGRLASRPQWDKCLARLREGDVLCITKLDRMGRSLQNLVNVVTLLRERGVGLKALDQDLDTTSPHGELIFNIFASVAQWEAAIIAERTREGLAAARAKHGGKLPGRKASLSDAQVTTLRELFAQRKYSAAQIGEILGVSRSTVYRHLGEHQADEGGA